MAVSLYNQQPDIFPLALREEFPEPSAWWDETLWQRVVRHCDAVSWLRELPENSVDLVYIDPPFGTGRKLVMVDKSGVERGFRDLLADVSAYVDWLSEVLKLIQRILKSTGSLFVHLDWRTVHYVKVAMDRIFGCDNFKNEIIWAYRTAGNSKKYFARKHDTILFYSKDWRKTKFFIPKERSYLKKQYNYGAHYPEYYDSETGQYFSEVLMRDVWSDISPLKGCNREKVGYPTQKPLKLLERIIEATTEPGDVVGDFFCGSGTTLVAAQHLGRRYFGCDSSREAVNIARARLLRSDAVNRGR